MKMKKSHLIIGIIAIIALVTAGYFFYINTSKAQVETGTEIGMMAPDFTLSDLTQQEVKLSDYRGKKVFLNFWATWCPPCQEEMPDIQKLHDNYGDKVTIVAVNVGESKAKAQSFMKAKEFNFPVLLDQNKQITSKYLVRGIPTTYLIDEDGIIMDKHVGILNYDQMLEKLKLKE
jgi:peroxiredoxin